MFPSGSDMQNFHPAGIGARFLFVAKRKNYLSNPILQIYTHTYVIHSKQKQQKWRMLFFLFFFLLYIFTPDLSHYAVQKQNTKLNLIKVQALYLCEKALVVWLLLCSYENYLFKWAHKEKLHSYISCCCIFWVTLWVLWVMF